MLRELTRRLDALHRDEGGMIPKRYIFWAVLLGCALIWAMIALDPFEEKEGKFSAANASVSDDLIF